MTYTYIRQSPAPPLDDYIDFLDYQDGFIYPHEMKPPMTSQALVINLGGPIQVLDAFHARPLATLTESFVIGSWHTCHVANWPSQNRFFSVRFKPGEAYRFLHLPLDELHNQHVSLELIWGPGAAEIQEQLAVVPTIQAGFGLLERLLLARLDETPYGHEVVRYGVAEIARHHGALSIRTLSDQIGISQNHLLTQFKRMVGVSPKVLARLYRLQQVMRTIDPTKPVDWTWIAYECGYYDQAHFNKDFMAHLGLNPTDYLRLRRRVQADSPDHDRFLRNLPSD